MYVEEQRPTPECQRLRNETTFMERKWEAESVGVGTVRPQPQNPKVRQQTRTTAG